MNGSAPTFRSPPSACIFRPTAEEFADPLAYIQKIKPQAEITGICKIVPPPGWNPPFALDKDTFKFHTRKQQLNELEAEARQRLNFFENLNEFNALSGNNISRIVNVSRKPLDIYQLHREVERLGGYDNVVQRKQWLVIGANLGIDKNICTSMSYQLRRGYERYLLPYDNFMTKKKAGHFDKGRKKKPLIKHVHQPTKQSPKTTPIKIPTSSTSSSPALTTSSSLSNTSTPAATQVTSMVPTASTTTISEPSVSFSLSTSTDVSATCTSAFLNTPTTNTATATSTTTSSPSSSSLLSNAPVTNHPSSTQPASTVATSALTTLSPELNSYNVQSVISASPRMDIDITVAQPSLPSQQSETPPKPCKQEIVNDQSLLPPPSLSQSQQQLQLQPQPQSLSMEIDSTQQEHQEQQQQQHSINGSEMDIEQGKSHVSSQPGVKIEGIDQAVHTSLDVEKETNGDEEAMKRNAVEDNKPLVSSGDTKRFCEEHNLSGKDEILVPAKTDCNLKSETSSTSDIAASTIVQPEDDFSLVPPLPNEMDYVFCEICTRGEPEETMLLCDSESCPVGIHMECLSPPLLKVPAGLWFCPSCLSVVCDKPKDSYGFTAGQEYTIPSFSIVANDFKRKYFGTLDVSDKELEQAFWKIIMSNEEVTVEYGADLHSRDLGSGFPCDRHNTQTLNEAYAKNGWNLNNLPLLSKSVISHFGPSITGMTVPWLYVGMCFSSFCWHVEDHYTYSINYVHWGEKKTWYGVSGKDGATFDKVAKELMPDLFAQQPDLLCHLTTMINPNYLMDQNVPVFRLDQNPGEFVITFPRSYHAGFNQGFNFAEAVNFAPADWIPWGRLCKAEYMKIQRYPVFAHEELMCNVANNTEDLDTTIARMAYADLLISVDQETKSRNRLLNNNKKGKCITKTEFLNFDEIDDDERKCSVCLTTSYLSGVKCSCNDEIMSCLDHCREMCSCPISKRTLFYRYTLKELGQLLEALKTRGNSVVAWVRMKDEFLEKYEKPKIAATLSLLQVGVDEEVLKSAEYIEFYNSLQQALDIQNEAAKLFEEYRLSRRRGSGYEDNSGTLDNGNTKKSKKFTIERVKEIIMRLTSSPYAIEEEIYAQLVTWNNRYEYFIMKCHIDNIQSLKCAKLELLADEGRTLEVDVSDIIIRLENYIRYRKWCEKKEKLLNYGKGGKLEKVLFAQHNNTMSALHLVTVETLYALIKEAKDYSYQETELEGLTSLAKKFTYWQQMAANLIESSESKTPVLATSSSPFYSLSVSSSPSTSSTISKTTTIATTAISSSTTSASSSLTSSTTKAVSTSTVTATSSSSSSLSSSTASLASDSALSTSTCASSSPSSSSSSSSSSTTSSPKERSSLRSSVKKEAPVTIVTYDLHSCLKVYAIGVYLGLSSTELVHLHRDLLSLDVWRKKIFSLANSPLPPAPSAPLLNLPTSPSSSSLSSSSSSVPTPVTTTSTPQTTTDASCSSLSTSSSTLTSTLSTPLTQLNITSDTSVSPSSTVSSITTSSTCSSSSSSLTGVSFSSPLPLIPLKNIESLPLSMGNNVFNIKLSYDHLMQIVSEGEKLKVINPIQSQLKTWVDKIRTVERTSFTLFFGRRMKADFDTVKPVNGHKVKKLLKLRKFNQEKPDCSSTTYCICKKKFNPNSFMIECSICQDWFHASCVKIKTQNYRKEESSSEDEDEEENNNHNKGKSNDSINSSQNSNSADSNSAAMEIDMSMVSNDNISNSNDNNSNNNNNNNSENDKNADNSIGKSQPSKTKHGKKASTRTTKDKSKKTRIVDTDTSDRDSDRNDDYFCPSCSPMNNKPTLESVELFLEKARKVENRIVHFPDPLHVFSNRNFDSAKIKDIPVEIAILEVPRLQAIDNVVSQAKEWKERAEEVIRSKKEDDDAKNKQQDDKDGVNGRSQKLMTKEKQMQQQLLYHYVEGLALCVAMKETTILHGFVKNFE